MHAAMALQNGSTGASALLSASRDGSVRVWDLHSFMALGVLKAHESSVEGMLIVPENGYLVTCSTDHTVRVWDYTAGLELQVGAALPSHLHIWQPVVLS